MSQSETKTMPEAVELWVEIWDESEGSPMIVSRPVSYRNFKAIDKAKVYHLIHYDAYSTLKAECEKLKQLFAVQLDVMEQHAALVAENADLITALKLAVELMNVAEHMQDDEWYKDRDKINSVLSKHDKKDSK